MLRLSAPAARAVLLHDIACPAVAMRPERTLRAGLAVGVIDPLLMRAADDPVRHDNRFGALLQHEPEDIAANGRIGPNVALFGEQALQYRRLGTLRVHNRHHDFARPLVIGTVERDGRHRIATEAAASLLFQRGIGMAFDPHGKTSLPPPGSNVPISSDHAERRPHRAGPATALVSYSVISF